MWNNKTFILNSQNYLCSAAVIELNRCFSKVDCFRAKLTRKLFSNSNKTWFYSELTNSHRQTQLFFQLGSNEQRQGESWSIGCWKTGQFKRKETGRKEEAQWPKWLMASNSPKRWPHTGYAHQLTEHGRTPAIAEHLGEVGGGRGALRKPSLLSQLWREKGSLRARWPALKFQFRFCVATVLHVSIVQQAAQRS